ncbi:MAG: sugar phosphate isomerase/epimerase [Planctomycetota bacterium]|nr:sugar phosphate isomerase/epimerase [Planctomycetota bacterium]
MGTRTGNFPIGFRRGWSDWQKNDLKALAGWAKKAGFDVIDLGKPSPEEVAVLKSEGIKIGTADLHDWPQVMSADAAKRKDAIAKNAEYMKGLSAAGCKRYFVVIIPEDGAKNRLENYKLAVEGWGELSKAAEKVGATIVIEGWPGGGNLPNLCCNPETYRALFKDTGSKPGGGLGVNYDPSHLIRMGIDHVRFIDEFAPYVGHVHGKDTEVFDDVVYECGLYQPSVFNKGHGFGEHAWRYTIPGHGVTRWTRVFQALAKAKFDGAVCVELEDENYNGSEAGEKNALDVSLAYLKTV